MKLEKKGDIGDFLEIKKERRISQRAFPNRTYIEMKKQFFFDGKGKPFLIFYQIYS